MKKLSLKKTIVQWQKETSIIAAALVALTVSSCNQPFDANAPLEKRLVVFSVLSTDRDAQFVRVQSSYMPPDIDPNTYAAEHEVMDARVYIRDSVSTRQLQDTLLMRPDTSRYKFPIHAYTLTGFVPSNGKTYRIEVQSPTLGTASGSVFIPDKATIILDATTNALLRIPFRFPDETTLLISTRLSRRTKAYIFRMYLYYDVLKGNEYVEERAEIPVASSSGIGFSLGEARYGNLTLSQNANDLVLKYSDGYYLAVIRNITTERYPTNRITYKWIVFSLLQMEENLYRYYSSVHEYRDPLSVRLDQAIYSGLSAGAGMVGAYALDSLLYVLPANFDGNR